MAGIRQEPAARASQERQGKGFVTAPRLADYAARYAEHVDLGRSGGSVDGYHSAWKLFQA